MLGSRTGHDCGPCTHVRMKTLQVMRRHNHLCLLMTEETGHAEHVLASYKRHSDRLYVDSAGAQQSHRSHRTILQRRALLFNSTRRCCRNFRVSIHLLKTSAHTQQPGGGKDQRSPSYQRKCGEVSTRHRFLLEKPLPKMFWRNTRRRKS